MTRSRQASFLVVGLVAIVRGLTLLALGLPMGQLLAHN